MIVPIKVIIKPAMSNLNGKLNATFGKAGSDFGYAMFL